MERIRQVPLSLMKCPGEKPAPTPHFLLPSQPLNQTPSFSQVQRSHSSPASSGASGGWRWHGPGALESWHWAQALLPFPFDSLSNLCLLSKPQSPHLAAWQLRSQELMHIISLRARSPHLSTGWRCVPTQTRVMVISSLGSHAQGAANPSSPRITSPGALR